MQFKEWIFLMIVGLIVFACGDQEQTSNLKVEQSFPDEFSKVLEAHGGIEAWQKKAAMTYTLDRGERQEIHSIDLRNRKVSLKSEEWTIGFDGEEVWVEPNKEAYKGSSARFYHNLIFYFYAMPFVLADPGIEYAVLAPREIKGKLYNRISVSYQDGVGDAPDDEYILCYDPETNQMEWLFYTVTYFSKEKGDRYNALHYTDWKETSGVLLPESMTGYRTSGDTITEQRYTNRFEDVVISEEPFDQSMFEMPANAEIDSLK